MYHGHVMRTALLTIISFTAALVAPVSIIAEDALVMQDTEPEAGHGPRAGKMLGKGSILAEVVKVSPTTLDIYFLDEYWSDIEDGTAEVAAQLLLVEKAPKGVKKNDMGKVVDTQKKNAPKDSKSASPSVALQCIFQEIRFRCTTPEGTNISDGSAVNISRVSSAAGPQKNAKGTPLQFVYPVGPQS